jgi:hypothetical protein
MAGIFIGPHMAVVPKSPKEGVEVHFEGGAGWLNGKAYKTELPDVFKALDNLLLYYEITQHRWNTGVLDVFSLNGVPTSVAIAVLLSHSSYSSKPYLEMLYMAPSHAESFWYYLLNWFDWAPPLNFGPVITAHQARHLDVKYVGIWYARPDRIHIIYPVPTKNLTLIA